MQGEVKQKVKNKYHILTYVCGIYRSDIDEPICRSEIETQTERMDVWTQLERGGWANWEIRMDTYKLSCVE